MGVFEGLQLNRFQSKRRKIAHSEYAASNFIPYERHYNANTIITKSNELVSIVKVLGFSFETADDIDLMSRKETRNNLFKGFASGQFALYFHTIRKKHEAYPEGTFTDPVCQVLENLTK
mgnify:CR=1 FL=1